MKKLYIKWVFIGLFCALTWYVNSEKQVKAEEERIEYSQDVPLDKAHFPDESFRQRLRISLDKNKDGVLSWTEREDVHYVLLSGHNDNLSWYTDMRYAGYNYEFTIGYEMRKKAEVYNKEKKMLYVSRYDKPVKYPIDVLDITGIEYLFNLEEIIINDYDVQKGSLKKNLNLKKVWVKDPFHNGVSYEKLKQEIPLSQLTYLHMVNISIPPEGINVADMPNLEVLRIIKQDETNQRLKMLDLSQNKKLKDLELANIVPSELNLQNNTKLKSVKVYTGEEICKKNAKHTYYHPKKNMSCKIQFPKKNSISTLYYFVDNNNLDIRNLTKLENIQTIKKVKLKANSSWVRKTFNKKTKSCIILKNGVSLKKIKPSRKKTTKL